MKERKYLIYLTSVWLFFIVATYFYLNDAGGIKPDNKVTFAYLNLVMYCFATFGILIVTGNIFLKNTIQGFKKYSIIVPLGFMITFPSIIGIDYCLFCEVVQLIYPAEMLLGNEGYILLVFISQLFSNFIEAIIRMIAITVLIRFGINKFAALRHEKVGK